MYLSYSRNVSNFYQRQMIFDCTKKGHKFLAVPPDQEAVLRQSGWLLSKSVQAINAGEGVEKREPSYTVGGNAN